MEGENSTQKSYEEMINMLPECERHLIELMVDIMSLDPETSLPLLEEHFPTDGEMGEFNLHLKKLVSDLLLLKFMDMRAELTSKLNNGL